MHPTITYQIARERPRDMLARAERQRLARSAAAARSSARPVRSPGPIVRRLICGGP
jgi:hypothetical protein